MNAKETIVSVKLASKIFSHKLSNNSCLLLIDTKAKGDGIDVCFGFCFFSSQKRLVI